MATGAKDADGPASRAAVRLPTGRGAPCSHTRRNPLPLTGGAYDPPGQSPHGNARGENAKPKPKPTVVSSKPFDGTPFVQDTDFTLYVGDVREVLATLPDESVQCVVTSPPYWGLRDYGTGSWDGGNPDCDHLKGRPADEPKDKASTLESRASNQNHEREGFGSLCGKCGAHRIDQQLGLEPTPELYVENMVAVFREVKRVLRKDGSLWLNIGDSYVHGPSPGYKDLSKSGLAGLTSPSYVEKLQKGSGSTRATFAPGLKPKDLCGIPWRLAFALQADGWYLRSEIIWAKPNPMPESVTDRPTKSHEQVFLLTRSPRYFFDQEAVREPTDDLLTKPRAFRNGDSKVTLRNDEGNMYEPRAGRNVRSVWEIATQPYAEAHFATYPEELVRRCVLAGCPEWVCGTCGKPRERLVERESTNPWSERRDKGASAGSKERGYNENHGQGMSHTLGVSTQTVGWSDCGHNDYRPGVVLDPFLGSGTTALVARRLGRRSVGIELNQEYADMAAKRLSQLSLLA